MSQNNFQEIFAERLKARDARSEKTDKVGDAITLIMALSVATTEVAKAINSVKNSQPLPQA